MKLDPEQRSILNGEQGQAKALAIRSLIRYGESFGAHRLVPIKSAHLAGSFGALSYSAYFKVLDQFINEGLKVKVPTTVNPKPGHDYSLINRIAFAHQNQLDRKMMKLGVTPNYSCVCYEKDNIPAFGDCIAWAESSAVQFANSVLGARTNRNSVLIDLCSALTGFTPEFGYLLDESRRGRILVKLKIHTMDPGALGFIIGREAVNKVPVIEHFDFSWTELKNMGGAMAAAGGIAMFHVEGLTPEAPDMKTAFMSTSPEATLTITQDDLKKFQSIRQAQSELVVFGCPHMTYDEAFNLAGYFTGKRSKKDIWFCMIPEAKLRFEQTDLYNTIRKNGVKVFSHCPLSALTVQVLRKKVLTPSGKLFYYLKKASYTSLDECIKICGAM